MGSIKNKFNTTTEKRKLISVCSTKNYFLSAWSRMCYVSYVNKTRTGSSSRRLLQLLGQTVPAAAGTNCSSSHALWSCISVTDCVWILTLWLSTVVREGYTGKTVEGSSHLQPGNTYSRRVSTCLRHSYAGCSVGPLSTMLFHSVWSPHTLRRF